MADSVYKIIEVVGTSPESWEKAAIFQHPFHERQAQLRRRINRGLDAYVLIGYIVKPVPVEPAQPEVGGRVHPEERI